MRVAVLGLWHLGSVTAVCLAAAGHDVTAYDPDVKVIDALAQGQPPVAEPGLADLTQAQLAAGRLRFVTDRRAAVQDADLVWITYDTPVDDEDQANTAWVIWQIQAMYSHLPDNVVVLISSQLPVGSVRSLEVAWRTVARGRTATFACSPENLRLGRAIDVFTDPDRVVIGVRDAPARELLTKLFAPITDRLEWMTVESAEMTKHAVNAFLATSVTFINEVATLCEQSGADAKEVERGLKTERRIGPGAYLSPGAAFAGGTLARDIVFLRALGAQVGRATPVMDGVHASNDSHRMWAARRLETELGVLSGKPVAIWGLTYKPGTDTLRRSSAIELCEWLVQQGARVTVHDPAVPTLPASLQQVTKKDDPLAAATAAEALVIATEWPEYRTVAASDLLGAMARPLVIDPNRFLQPNFGADARITLLSVGQPRA